MSEFTIGFVGGVIIASIVVGGILFGELTSWKMEAYDRGHMVQCLGKTGYYWSCE